MDNKHLARQLPWEELLLLQLGYHRAGLFPRASQGITLGFRSKLYWLDRAFKGDRRPIYFVIGWAALVVVAIGLLKLMTITDV